MNCLCSHIRLDYIFTFYQGLSHFPLLRGTPRRDSR
nr:MAG TPA: hypothetical protein [Caudoviricetes sp.]